jgi:hypothetical protein
MQHIGIDMDMIAWKDILYIYITDGSHKNILKNDIWIMGYG